MTCKIWEDMKEQVGGARKDGTPSKSVFVDGKWHNGTKFGSHEHTVHVSTSQRCYTLVQLYQTPRNLVGPTVGAKVPMEQDLSDHQLLQKEIIEVRSPSHCLLPHLYQHLPCQAATPLAIHTLEAGTLEVAAALKLQADVTNLPPVRFEGNYTFLTMQLNITPTQPAGGLTSLLMCF